MPGPLSSPCLPADARSTGLIPDLPLFLQCFFTHLIFSKAQHLRSKVLKNTSTGAHLFWLKHDLTLWDLQRRHPRESHQFLSFSFLSENWDSFSFLRLGLIYGFSSFQLFSWESHCLSGYWHLGPATNLCTLPSLTAFMPYLLNSKWQNIATQIFTKFLIEDTALIRHTAISKAHSSFKCTPHISIFEAKKEQAFSMHLHWAFQV